MKPLVPFMRWCLDPAGRTRVAVDPTRVDCVEFFSDEIKNTSFGEDFPAATKIIMKGKQEYIVQGGVEEVVFQLNKGN
jgi:hypothetical protein